MSHINKQIAQFSFLNAIGVVIYVAFVAVIMQNGEKIFGKMSNYTGPIVFLLLFVLSAAVTGALVLGRPVLMYLENEKKLAVRLFLATLGWLFMFVVLFLGVNLLL